MFVLTALKARFRCLRGLNSVLGFLELLADVFEAGHFRVPLCSRFIEEEFVQEVGFARPVPASRDDNSNFFFI